MKTNLVLWLVAFGACSCGASLRGDDGFSSKVLAGCATEFDCQELHREAKHRMDFCDTPKRVTGCDRASRDLSATERLLAEKIDARQAREQREREEQNKREDQERKDRQALQDEHRFQAQEWTKGVISRCEQSWADLDCTGGPEWLSPEDRELCRRRCSGHVDDAIRLAVNAEALLCAQRVAESHPPTKAACKLVAPEGATRDLSSHQKDCLERCVSLAEQALASGAPSRPRGASCCDGTPLSAKCASGGKGCCARHGGLCK